MKFKDKIQHFIASFILAAIFYYLTGNKLLTIFLVLVLGLLKEYYDQRRNRNTTQESLADIFADVIGITGGIIFIQYVLL